MQVNIPIFKNDRKEKLSQPDYRYSFQDSQGEWHNVISGWLKESAKGNKYLSLSIDTDQLKAYIEHDEQSKQAGAQQPLTKQTIDPNDLPF